MKQRDCRLIRREKHARMESMATKVAQNKTRDFWQEIKRMRQTKTIAPAIDGRTEFQDIANHFQEKYQHLYTSVPSSEENISSIEQCINKHIADARPVNCVVTEKEISEAINELKNGKSDGSKGLISDHVKHAPKRLHTLLSLLLTTSIR